MRSATIREKVVAQIAFSWHLCVTLSNRDAIVKIEAVRKANLQQLAKQMGSAELSRKLGYRHPSYLTQMIGPSANRPLSEKNARKYEQQLGLTNGWFDQQHADIPEPAPARQEPASTDLVATVIRLVGTVLQDENINVPPARFADLVALAYTDAADHAGQPREAHIKQLVRLLK